MLVLQAGGQRLLPPAKVASTVQARSAAGRSGILVMQSVPLESVSAHPANNCNGTYPCMSNI